MQASHSIIHTIRSLSSNLPKKAGLALAISFALTPASHALTFDSDGDGIANDIDNCPLIANPNQWNKDGDAFGNECDDDIDGDGCANDIEIALGTKPWQAGDVPSSCVMPEGEDSDQDGLIDELDNCPSIANPGQWDKDLDGQGNECDADIDGDQCNNDIEIALGTKVWNAQSVPLNCTMPSGPDSDNDGVADSADNCPNTSNPGQWDKDGDQQGNECDDDIDGDGYSNEVEALAGTKIWDAKSFPSDSDSDGIADAQDNCPNETNTDQADLDNDQQGDVCDRDIDGDGHDNYSEIDAGTDPYDANSPGAYSGPTLVYKNTGSQQCLDGSGETLLSMNTELESANVNVSCGFSGWDGYPAPAACGFSTGEIHIFDIASQDLNKATELGYQHITNLELYTYTSIVERANTDCQAIEEPISPNGPTKENHYDALKTNTAPVIDGVAEGMWDKAEWDIIDTVWRVGKDYQHYPSASDYQGRYKVMWDQDYIYMLYEITDDVLSDVTANPLESYWNDDTVEIFVDEDNSGGNHGSEGNYNQAFAYHVSSLGDNVDWLDSSGPTLLTDHLEVKIISQGNKHIWEMRMRIYDDSYNRCGQNTPVKLFEGKEIGFSASYIDNDGASERDHMLGSVDSELHKNNEGYFNADSFGTLKLIK